MPKATAKAGSMSTDSGKVDSQGGVPAHTGARSSASSRHASRFNLTSLPSAWLRDLLLHATLSPADILSLFQSCKVIRDQVLALRTRLFDIVLLGQADAEAIAQLVLACNLSPKMKIMLHSSGSAGPFGDLVCGAMASLGYALEGIVQVTLEGVVLDAVFPSFLITTCPNLTTFKLVSCYFIGLPAPDVGIPECSQLQHLHLHGCIARPQAFLELRWQHQLLSFTNLAVFTMTGYAYSSNLPDACNVMSTHFKEISLPDSSVPDFRMEMLLSCPRKLPVLSCQSFGLQLSYSHRPCPWEQLKVSKIDIGTLDRLPLQGCTQVTASTILPCHDWDITNRAVARSLSSGVRWTQPRVLVDNSDIQASTTRLAALMPLLALCSELVLDNSQPVTPQLLAAMGQHLGQCHTITFLSHTWALEALPRALTSLPPSVHSILIGRGEVFESELMLMCVYACRPITVSIHSSVLKRWGVPGWQARIQAAMAAAGHQHVKLLTW